MENREKALALLRSYVEFRGKDTLAKAGCNKLAYLHWNCCDYHRNLSREYDQLKADALSLKLESEGQPLSETWWHDCATKFSFELPTDFERLLYR